MKKKETILWGSLIAFFVLALGVNAVTRNVATFYIEQDTLLMLLDNLTRKYQLYQVITAVLIYGYGYVVVTALLKGKLCEGWKVVLAFPTANAIWGSIAAVILCLNIPFNLLSMGIACGAVLLLCLIKKGRQVLDSMNFFVKEMFGVLSIAIILSTGVLPVFMSHDSLYYIMQYGELIANNNGLYLDHAGIFMTWTGVTPALISSLAAMCGFETIYVLHYMLLLSLFTGIGVAAYEQAILSYKKWVSIIMSIALSVMLLLVPSILLLSNWPISNTYFMIYMFFLLYLATHAAKTEDYSLSLLLAIYAVWMILSRVETGPVVCFLIVAISGLRMSKKKMLLIFSPAMASELLYLIKIQWDIASGMKQATQIELTSPVKVIIIFLMLLTLVYILLFDLAIVKSVRERLPWMLLSGLVLGNILLALYDFNKYWGNVKTVFYNLRYELWGAFPLVAVILTILVKVTRPKIDYWDSVTLGYPLFCFALCMGRHPLRNGYGDSYNRILISVLPIFVVVSFIKIIKDKNEEIL